MGVNNYLGDTKIKIGLVLIAMLFFAFVFITAGNPNWLGTKIIISAFLIWFSVFNLIKMKFWLKLLLAIILTVPTSLMLWGIILVGYLRLFH